MYQLIFLLFSLSRLRVVSSILISLLAATTTVVAMHYLSQYLGSQAFLSDAVVDIFFWGVLSVILSIFSHWSLSLVGLNVVKKLRLACSARFLEWGPDRRESFGEAKVRAVLSQDISQVADGLAAMPLVMVNILIITLSLVYLVYTDLAMALVIFVPMIIGYLLLRLLKTRMRYYFSSVREGLDIIYKCFDDLVGGYKEMFVYKELKEYFYNKKFKLSVDELFKAGRKAQLAWIVGMNYQVLMFFFLLAVLLIAANYEPSFQESMPLFILVLLYLKQPTSVVLYYIPDTVRASIALGRIKSLFGQFDLNPPRIMVSNEMAKEPNSLSLEHVEYKYQDKNHLGFCLGPISLKFYRGKVTYIVGGNGCGKSTMVKLISGLYKPTSGNICSDVNGTKQALNTDDVAIIYSDFYLFDYFLNVYPVNNTEILKGLNDFGLSDVVSFDEVKGFQYGGLSQGQKRRLALVSLLGVDRSIIIFDEWAADQDPEFRDYFYNSILPNMASAGKIVIVVTHDDRYFSGADDIVKLDRGKFVEKANKDVLPRENSELSFV